MQWAPMKPLAPVTRIVDMTDFNIDVLRGAGLDVFISITVCPSDNDNLLNYSTGD